VPVDVKDYIRDRLPLVDSALDKIVPPAEEPPTALHGAMRHLLFPSGKRFRPMLAFAGAEAVGGTASDAVPVACTVELIHTYSLVHDDLPCMDDDALRRGRPTVHIEYGEANAVLAGDALLALAYESLAEAPVKVGPDALVLAIRDLAHAAGSRQLVGGQADDLDAAGAASSIEQVQSVHARKTAALIRASIVGGARLAGADDSQLDALSAFGLEVGIAFQIADDVLDEGEDDPCSLVTALGVDGARERAEGLLETALARIASFSETADPLRALARFAVQRTQ
jgi:geranylgeranyl diphosphate synthase type II